MPDIPNAVEQDREDGNTEVPVQPDSERAGMEAAAERLAKVATRLHPKENRALLSVPVAIQAVIGSTHRSLAELMDIQFGDLVLLDQKVGDPVGILANGKLIARGEIVVSDDTPPKLGITVLELTGEDGASEDD